MGIEKSLLGTRARLESESHTQEEYVKEADMARRLMSNLRSTITIDTPTAANEVWRQVRKELFSSSSSHSEQFRMHAMGSNESLQSIAVVSSVVRHVKGSERSLSQRINCYASNAGTGYDSLRGRWTDHQCHNWDSEVVVVGGVTTTQGERENRSQGEGLQV